MKVIHAAAEVAPFCVSGGLGEVLAALPGAQRRAGADVALIVPRCRAAAGLDLDDVGVGFGNDARLLRDGAGLYFVDAPDYFDRPQLYGDEAGAYPDNPERFEFFCHAVIEAAPHLFPSEADVIHFHDWHTGLVPALTNTPTIFTIHNLDYQGVFVEDAVGAGGADYRGDGLFNFMRGAIATADLVTTVSPTYASEILTPQFGAGLHELLGERGVTGIVNGLDISAWDPATNPALLEPYDASSLAGKKAGREGLLAEFQIEAGPEDLVIGVVSRFAYQKGIDVVVDLVPRLEDLGAVLIVLGDGDPALERDMAAASATEPRASFMMGWDLEVAHRIIAGSDVVAVPSRFEPCGLIQMQAMRYGAIPVVHPVGGLADTVDDPGDEGLLQGSGTGIRFAPLTSAALAEALQRAIALRQDREAWERLVARVMGVDWSWDGSATRYLELYETL